MSYTWLIILLIVILILTSIVGIFLVIVQNKGQSPGLFGGGAQSAFGSREGDVLTRITGWIVGIFMLGSLVAAWTIGRSTAAERNQGIGSLDPGMPGISASPSAAPAAGEGDAELITPADPDDEPIEDTAAEPVLDPEIPVDEAAPLEDVEPADLAEDVDIDVAEPDEVNIDTAETRDTP